MGNRAVITTKAKKTAIYLHWNGGRNSVEGFLAYCKARGFRSTDRDPYGWAYLVQVIGNFFGDGLSVGVGNYMDMDRDNGDNGVYIIEGWEIVGREYFSGVEQGFEEGVTPMDFMKYVDECQPVRCQLGAAFFNSDPVDLDQVKVGDRVVVRDTLKGDWREVNVIGVAQGGAYEGMLYTDEFQVMDGGYPNPNSILREGREVRKVRG